MQAPGNTAAYATDASPRTAVTLAPLGAGALLLVTAVTVAVFKPWARPGSNATDRGRLVLRHLRRGRQRVYERNMIDELALRLVHGELPVGS